jgi:hypothetical protein
MSGVSVSVKLSQKQAGELYMRAMRQADRITKLKAALRRIVVLAEESKDFTILTAAKAALEPPAKKEPSNA